MKNNFQVAVNFGNSLDHDDFETTKKLLSTDCIYFIGEQVLKGPKEITNSYGQNMIDGRKKLDNLEWGKSSIEKISEFEYFIHFTDYLTHKGLSHIHKCMQKITINEKGFIHKTQHIHNEEEQKNLNGFYHKVGVLKK